MNRRTALVVLAGMVGLAGPAAADETTFCNQFITTLPYTITVQGHYCFNRNLSTAITTGNAITINADYVLLDLNNFKLGGGSAGVATDTIGVYALNRRNITVRNGNIRGFLYGIKLEGGGLHTVENNVLDGNTYTGAHATGDAEIVRNNIVANTGGSASTTVSGWSYGIYSYSTGSNAGSSVVSNNVISNVFDAAVQTGTSSGIAGNPDYAENNIVTMAPSNGSEGGVWADVCRDNTVLQSPSPYSCTAVGHNYP